MSACPSVRRPPLCQHTKDIVVFPLRQQFSEIATILHLRTVSNLFRISLNMVQNSYTETTLLADLSFVSKNSHGS